MHTVDVSGLELARAYHAQVVGPLLARHAPGLRYAAARLGSGSDVLGLDDAMSRDHDWGLRLTLLVDADDVAGVDALLENQLPETFRGLPTRFATTWEPVVRHRVQVDTADGFAESRLGVATERDWDPVDWLSLTGQAVLEVTAGAVFTDPVGRLTAIRERLRWYPDDLWWHVVAVDWQRIGQELPLLARAADRGDDVGAGVLLGRLSDVAVHLGFLLRRYWPPYPKWRGTVFATVPGTGEVSDALGAALGARGPWSMRLGAFTDALRALFELQRATGLPTGPEPLEQFWDRPYPAVRDSVVTDLLAAITDPHVRSLPRGVGSVEQWVDNVDVLCDPTRRVAAARALVPGDGR